MPKRIFKGKEGSVGKSISDSGELKTLPPVKTRTFKNFDRYKTKVKVKVVPVSTWDVKTKTN